MNGFENHAGFNITTTKLQVVEVTGESGKIKLSNLSEVFFNVPLDFDKDKENRRFGKIVCHANKLIGANFFNVDVDGGALQYLIRNRIDVGAHRQQLLSNPKEIGRWLMCESEKKNKLSLEHQEIKK